MAATPSRVSWVDPGTGVDVRKFEYHFPQTPIDPIHRFQNAEENWAALKKIELKSKTLQKLFADILAEEKALTTKKLAIMDQLLALPTATPVTLRNTCSMPPKPCESGLVAARSR